MKPMRLTYLAIVLFLIMENFVFAAAEPAEETDLYAEDDEYAQTVTISDPIEPWNRAMYQFNDKLYFWVLKPVAKGYSFLVPEPGRVAVHNIYDNIKAPIRVVNNFLQLKIKQSGIELGRFLINTTIGIAGIWDPAKDCYDLKPCPEDLGQTFGHYGLGCGFYIVWPFLGPSSVRDTVGYGGDLFLNPINYIDPAYVPYAIEAHRTVNETSLHIGDYEALKQAAIDPYVALRDAYAQNRNKEVNQ
jgi:phospholipid-binding lipoprotein MlaA